MGLGQQTCHHLSLFKLKSPSDKKKKHTITNLLQTKTLTFKNAWNNMMSK